ncbi:MAG: hypothetical protein JJU26_01735 [Oceanicaulis sp.]|uniref:hypothetical protein n=1 Tax=Glycocaulis sp. TaxID=1969725 RepID=UPI0025C15343|nr:hypothetical protein [Glycocaulis sp.]MCC5980418.1 hypothetical protein [Oceanicaulis sp.]MCH8520665.1 hypothetical protein [Glycocaulis sp.]
MADAALAPSPETAQETPARPGFFFYMSLVMLALVFIGFSKTFYLRAFFEQEEFMSDAFMTRELYIHGSVMTGWYVLLVIQTFLIGRGAYGVHKVMGLAGLALAAAVILTGIPVITGFAPRLISAGLEADMVLPIISVLIWFDILALAAFAGLVGMAVLLRGDGNAHKRLMLLASITFMLPATFRIVNGYAPDWPAMPIALIVSLLLLAVMAVYDFRTLRKLHPATLFGGIAVAALTALGFVIGASGAGQGFVAGML